MVKEVVRIKKFLELLRKLDKSVLNKVEKLIIKIIEDPETGKPMQFDRKGTREVYSGSFRLSYSYDKKEDILYILNFYHKDEQ